MKDKVKDYLNNHKSIEFKELLFKYIDESGYKDSEIYKKVDIDRKLFSKIRCHKNYVPSRSIVIKLCLALNLKRNDFNKLLNSAGYSLKNNQIDLIIAYCIDNSIYDINVINDYLLTYTNTVL